MVSNARLDLPEPESPVTTMSRSRGISTEMFLRLCTRAPCTAMVVRAEARGALRLAVENFFVIPKERPEITLRRAARVRGSFLFSSSGRIVRWIFSAADRSLASIRNPILVQLSDGGRRVALSPANRRQG